MGYLVCRRRKTTGDNTYSFQQGIDPSIAVAFCRCGLDASEVVPSCHEASVSSIYETVAGKVFQACGVALPPTLRAC